MRSNYSGCPSYSRQSHSCLHMTHPERRNWAYCLTVHSATNWCHAHKGRILFRQHSCAPRASDPAQLRFACQMAPTAQHSIRNSSIQLCHRTSTFTPAHITCDLQGAGTVWHTRSQRAFTVPQVAQPHTNGTAPPMHMQNLQRSEHPQWTTAVRCSTAVAGRVLGGRCSGVHR